MNLMDIWVEHSAIFSPSLHVLVTMVLLDSTLLFSITTWVGIPMEAATRLYMVLLLFRSLLPYILHTPQK